MENSQRGIGFADSLRTVIAHISDNLRKTDRYPGIAAFRLYNRLVDLKSNPDYTNAMNETGLNYFNDESFEDVLFQMGVPWGGQAMLETSPTGITYMDENQSRRALKTLDRLDIQTRTQSHLKDIAKQLTKI